VESVIIIGVLVTSIFLPMIIFGFIGYKALVDLGQRPNEGGRVMIPLILKLVITATFLIAALIFVLDTFG
jgi:hypothetical protein